MKSPWQLLLLTLAGWLLAAAVPAQRATELYIPIGRSPGVSGKLSAVGTCTTIEARARQRSVTIRAPERTWTSRLTDETKIYLDRSRLGLPNTYGTIADLRADLLMEVKYREAGRASGGVCEWIKVQVLPSEPRPGR